MPRSNSNYIQVIFNNKAKAEQEKAAAQKSQAAQYALKKLTALPLEDLTLGIGTGSTINIMIEQLAQIKNRLRKPAAVSSKASATLLDKYGIAYEDNNMINGIDLYIDGADEVDEFCRMIKGGGGALTGEKILASQAKEFWCVVDESKRVDVLGNFPVAVEMVKSARSLVSRELLKMGGNPEYRHDFISDHGNPIVDVYGLDLTEPLKMEERINNLPGVVCNGIFARNYASKVICATDDGVIELTRPA